MDLGLSTSPNQFPDLAYSIRVWRISVKMFHHIQLLSDILPVRGFHVALFHHSVMKGGVNLFMPKQPLHLFDRHSFVNGGCGHGPPEFVWVHVMNITLFTHLLQHDLDSTRQQAFMRITD